MNKKICDKYNIKESKLKKKGIIFKIIFILIYVIIQKLKY